MKKILVFMFVMVLIVTMTVPAFAVTPTFKYNPVKIPEIKVSVKIPDKVFDDWFKEHPIKITYTHPTLG
jgi:hypothetical protein